MLPPGRPKGEHLPFVGPLLHELRLVLVALQFLTRVPVPRWVGYDPAWLQACLRHFPLVGAAVGSFGAAVLWAASALWPPMVAAVLSGAATVWLTGAFHEDGLADTCDGLGGAVSRERALAIMKDSRIGSYGAVALVLALGLKVATVAALLDPGAGPAGAGGTAGAAGTAGIVWAGAALIWGHAASRAAVLLLIWRLPYAGDADHAKAKPLALQAEGRQLLVAGGWLVMLAAALIALAGPAAGAHPLVPAGAMAPVAPVAPVESLEWVKSAGPVGPVQPVGSVLGSWLGSTVEPMLPALLLALMAGAIATFLCARWLRRRLGGFTGDTLGATQQLVELASLLAWAASPAVAHLAHPLSLLAAGTP